MSEAVAAPPIAINIDAESINTYVANKILESKLGAEMKKAIESYVNGFGYNDNPMKRAVEQVAYGILRDLVENEYRDKLKEVFRQRLTDEFLTKFSEKINIKMDHWG